MVPSKPRLREKKLESHAVLLGQRNSTVGGKNAAVRTTFKQSEFAITALQKIAKWTERTEKKVIHDYCSSAISGKDKYFEMMLAKLEGTTLSSLVPETTRKTRSVSKLTVDLLDEACTKYKVSRDLAFECAVFLQAFWTQLYRDSKIEKLEDAKLQVSALLDACLDTQCNIRESLEDTFLTAYHGMDSPIEFALSEIQEELDSFKSFDLPWRKHHLLDIFQTVF